MQLVLVWENIYFMYRTREMGLCSTVHGTQVPVKVQIYHTDIVVTSIVHSKITYLSNHYNIV